MKIYQSLADASLYKTVAIIPEQVMFGLALARDPSLRNSAETQRNLRLGMEFCQVFRGLVEPAVGVPQGRSAAAIAAGIRELPEFTQWQDEIGTVRQTIGALLENGETTSKELDTATDVLRRFATFAKQRLSAALEAEHAKRSVVRDEWH